MPVQKYEGGDRFAYRDYLVERVEFHQAGNHNQRSHGNRGPGAVVNITQKQGGATRTLTGQGVSSGYSVGGWVPSSKTPASRFFAKDAQGRVRGEKILADFISKHKDKTLNGESIKIGLWHNKRTKENPKGDNLVYIDAIKVYPNTANGRKAARAAGRKNNEISIFHLDKFETIGTGGTG